MSELIHILPSSSESDSPWPLEGDASSGSAASPSAGLGLLQSSSGSAPAEKENRMAELGPDSFSAKATRQPGALPCSLLLRTDLISPSSKAKVSLAAAALGSGVFLSSQPPLQEAFRGNKPKFQEKSLTLRCMHRLASGALAAAMVQHLPSGLGQHGHRRCQLPDVHARQLRGSAAEPCVHRLRQRHLRLLLGLHPLQPLHHRHLRAQAGMPAGMPLSLHATVSHARCGCAPAIPVQSQAICKSMLCTSRQPGIWRSESRQEPRRCAAGDVSHGWAQGSRLCMMCPGNTTNLEDGSGSCPQAVLPGTNMTTRYAVIVSFGVYLNGTSLSDIAQKVTPCHCLQMCSEEATLWHSLCRPAVYTATCTAAVWTSS